MFAQQDASKAPTSKPRPATGGSHLVSRALASPGAPLDSHVRAAMEDRLGHDLSSVRIHRGPLAVASADAVGASAYTVGSHIVLPGSPTLTGSRLLAHELAHVVQQRDVTTVAAPLPGDAASENDARAVASGADPGILRSVGRAPVLHRQPLEPSHEGPVTSSTTKGRPAPPPGFLTGQWPGAGITASEWVDRHSAPLARRIRELLATTPFPLDELRATWAAGGQDRFVAHLTKDLLTSNALWWNLDRLLGTAALTRAVDAGRDAYPATHGSLDWYPGVASEIVSRLTVRINEAIPRVITRVGAYEMWRAQPVRRGASARQAVAPDARPLAASALYHPIDPYVFSALIDNVSFDWKRLQAQLAGPEAVDTERWLRPVRFTFQAAYGAPLWLRVIHPPDATIFEVAYELFGDLTSAHRLVDAHPLYGFGEENVGTRVPGYELLPRSGFRPEHRAEYEASLKTGAVMPVTAEPVSPMQQILIGRLGEEVSLRAAPALSDAGSTPATILQRFTLINDRFAQIRAIAPGLGHHPADPSFMISIGPQGLTRQPFRSELEIVWDTRLRIAAGRLRSRMERLAGSSDPQDVQLWDAQSVGQLEILNGAHAGLTVAVALAESYRGQPRIQEAIADIASRYVAAAEISDAYGPAKEQLAAAERQSQLFPVTAMELILADLRAAIDAARVSKVTKGKSNEERFALSELERTELQVRERLARVRPLLLSAPQQAKEELRNITLLLQNLQAGVTLVANLDAIDQVFRALIDSLSVTGEIRSWFGHYGNDKIIEAFDGALKLWREWQAIYAIWRMDPAEARRRLREKADSKEWKTWFSNMRELIRDQQQADRLMTLGIMLGIAIITGGIGAYVEAAAGAAWGATAGFFAATGAEALAFTSMSYAFLDKDPSVAGFFEHLAGNLATFGLLRFVGLGYAKLLGPANVATPLGKLGQIGTQFVVLNGLALHHANSLKKEKTGQPLSRDEMVAISLENLAFVGLVALGTAMLKSPLINLQLSGELAGANYRVRRSAAVLDSTIGITKALEAKGEMPTSELKFRLEQTENAFIAAERDLLLALGRAVRRANELTPGRRKNMLAKLGITESVAEAVKSGEGEQRVGAYLEALTAVQVQRALVPAGGGDFMVAGDKFDVVVAYFKSQGADVLGAGSPFASPPPGGVTTGLRSATIRLAGQPEIRVLESSTSDPRSLIAAETMLGTPFTQSARHVRMRAIARIILDSQVATRRVSAREPQATEVSAALKEIRDPFRTKPGDPPPPLEAYVPDYALRENIRAVRKLRAKLLKEDPDVIIGMERYGSLFADMLAYDLPGVQLKITRFKPARYTAESKGKKGKFDQPAMLAEFRRILGPDTSTARKVAVVDSYMGGSTTESLLEQVYKVLAAEYPNVHFSNYVIRETSGFKVSQGGKAVIPDIRGGASERYTGRVHNEVEEVSVVVGDDVALVYNLDSSEPVRVFDSSGKVVETFVARPGETTRDVLIRIVNGEYDALPPRPIPDPVGPVRARPQGEHEEEPAVPRLPAAPAKVPVP
jgi:Domain of unknown function (DUF4157)